MLSNIFLKTLRDQRWGALIWGLLLGILAMADILIYPELARDRAQAAQLSKAYESFGFLMGEGVSVETLGGYLLVEVFFGVQLLLGIWAVVVGVGIIRGEEEQGALEVLMSTPHGRMRVFWQKLAAFALALTVALLLVGAGIGVGVLSSNQSLPLWGTLAMLLNLGLLAAFWGAAGVLAGQIVGVRRTASIVVSALLFATLLLNNLAQSVSGLEWLGWLMPFHYFNLSKPVVPGEDLDPLGVGVLLAGVALLLGLAAWMFARRDIGSTFPLLRTGRATRAPRQSRILLGSVFQKSLRDQLVPAVWWGLGLGIYAAVISATAEQALEPIRESLSQIELFSKLFGDIASNEAYLSVALFFYLPLILVIYALTHIWGWAGDEEDGRMELQVVEPIPRWQILAARYLSAVVGLAIILALTAAGLLLTAEAVGLDFDRGRIGGALLATAPLVLVTLALGLALATWLARPSVAVALTGGVIVLMFFVETFASLFDWPEEVRNVSIFYLYGNPVMNGIVWANMAALALATVFLAVASILGFQRRDIVK